MATRRSGWRLEQVDADTSLCASSARGALRRLCLRHEPNGLDAAALDRHTTDWVARVNASGQAYLTPASSTAAGWCGCRSAPKPPSATTSKPSGIRCAPPSPDPHRLQERNRDRPDYFSPRGIWARNGAQVKSCQDLQPRGARMAPRGYGTRIRLAGWAGRARACGRGEDRVADGRRHRRHAGLANTGRRGIAGDNVDARGERDVAHPRDLVAIEIRLHDAAARRGQLAHQRQAGAEHRRPFELRAHAIGIDDPARVDGDIDLVDPHRARRRHLEIDDRRDVAVEAEVRRDAERAPLRGLARGPSRLLGDQLDSAPQAAGARRDAAHLPAARASRPPSRAPAGAVARSDRAGPRPGHVRQPPQVRR